MATNEPKPKPVRIEDYNGIWSVRHSPVLAPKPLVNKRGEPIRSWPPRELEFICSDQTGLALMARKGILEQVEEYVRRVGGTHYCARPDSVGGYLQVYRLKKGEIAIEGNWDKIRNR